MGLRCIFGHDFGETTTEKDREERGDEVVVTITEVRECDRCGEREVVSENTEVTTLDSTPNRRAGGGSAGRTVGGGAGSDADGTADGDAGGAIDRNARGSAGRGTSGGSGAGSPGETTADTTDGTPDATRAPESDVDVVVGEENDEPDGDDAEIIDGGPSESNTGSADAADGEAGRDPRAWPDSDETHPADAEGGDAGATGGDWPDHDSQNRGFDAGGADGGYDPTDGYDAGDGGNVAVGEATPEPAETGTVPGEDVEFVGDGPEPTTADTNGTEPVVESDGVAPEVDLTAPARETNREYFCPDCGHAETVGGSSMRKGDICPECLRGYIDERPVE